MNWIKKDFSQKFWDKKFQQNLQTKQILIIPSITRPIKLLARWRGNSKNRAQEGMEEKKGNTWIGKILIIMLMSRCAGPKDVEGKEGVALDVRISP